MVVSKLWLAGHLLPDLKPYTRRGRPGAPQAQLPWEKAAGAAAGGGKAGGKAAGSKAGAGAASGSSDGSGGAGLPPLIDVVTSQSSIASIGTSLCGSASMDAAAGSRSSILDSITAGSQVGARAGVGVDGAQAWQQPHTAQQHAALRVQRVCTKPGARTASRLGTMPPAWSEPRLLSFVLHPAPVRCAGASGHGAAAGGYLPPSVQ